MTKHDYQKALEWFNFLFPPIPDGGNSADKNQREMRNAIRHALKLAAIVTGEPSERMIEAGKNSFDLPKNVDVIFEAMIAEAQRQAEGV